MKLIPQFTQKDVQKDIEIFLNARLPLIEDALNYIGMQFVSNARQNTKLQGKTYPHAETGFYDHTANLRSSIGYVVTKNKRQVEKNFKGKGTGKRTGLSKALEIAQQHNGYVLSVVAGMEYAVYVEAKGYDVISNSAPLKSEVERIIKQFTGLK